jgi:hypothetical protein
MATRTSWRQVAEMLASRLSVHAFCEQHRLSDARPDCPWCRDRAAYRAYLAAGGREMRQAPDPDSRTVALEDLPPAEDLGVAHLRTAEDGTRYTEFRPTPPADGGEVPPC